ncbi:MAG: hypothetical protein IT211_12685 [Armatimonadetes bacterium]|nr:hypothetical protein [Armatimonadota bacterium]
MTLNDALAAIVVGDGTFCPSIIVLLVNGAKLRIVCYGTNNTVASQVFPSGIGWK